MNLVELLGKFKRDNTDLSFYEDNPELLDLLGEKGVKVTEGNLLFDILNIFTPQEERNRMRAFGNQILVPTGEMTDEDIVRALGHGALGIRKEGDGARELFSVSDGLAYDNLATLGVFEELPHTQQFREKGFLGMGLEFLHDMGRAFVKEIGEGDFKTAFNPVELQKELYGMEDTLETFHGDEPEKARLINKFLGEGAYFEHRGWPYLEGKPFDVDSNLDILGMVPEFPGYEYDGIVIPPYEITGIGLSRLGRTDYEYWDELYGDDQAILDSSHMPIDLLKDMYPEKADKLNEVIENQNATPSESLMIDEEMPGIKEYIPKDINEDGVTNILDILRLGEYEQADQTDFDRLINQSLYTDYMQD